MDYSIFDRTIRGKSRQYYDLCFIFSGDQFVFMEIIYYQKMFFFQIHIHVGSGEDFTISVNYCIVEKKYKTIKSVNFMIDLDIDIISLFKVIK